MEARGLIFAVVGIALAYILLRQRTISRCLGSNSADEGGADAPLPEPTSISANPEGLKQIRVVAFDAFGTMVKINDQKSPWREIARRSIYRVDARCEPSKVTPRSPTASFHFGMSSGICPAALPIGHDAAVECLAIEAPLSFTCRSMRWFIQLQGAYMAVLIVADLHLDQWLADGRDPLAAVDPDMLANLDALIIAGDLSNKPKVRWPHAIRHLSQYVDPARIHVLPGNHDYYDHTLDGDDRLAAIAASEGANFAQKTELVVGDTRFLCCTLWTDFELGDDAAYAQRAAIRGINDYRYIRMARQGYRHIWPVDTAAVHADHRQWLEGRLAMQFAGRTVVVTHHCPHPDLIGDQQGALAAAYGSDLLGVIARSGPAAWFFGHTHHRHQAREGQTLVRNVSLGYPQEVQVGDEAAILLRGCVSEGA